MDWNDSSEGFKGLTELEYIHGMSKIVSSHLRHLLLTKIHQRFFPGDAERRRPDDTRRSSFVPYVFPSFCCFLFSLEFLCLFFVLRAAFNASLQRQQQAGQDVVIVQFLTENQTAD